MSGLNFSKEDFEILQQAKSLLSHACPNNNWNEVFVALAKELIKNKLGKAKVSQAACLEQTIKDSHKEERRSDIITDTFSPQRLCATQAKKARPYIPIAIRKYVFNRANHCCEYTDHSTRQKCTSRYQLQTDHIIPIALNGLSDPSNLRVLCRTYNVLMARRSGLL